MLSMTPRTLAPWVTSLMTSLTLPSTATPLAVFLYTTLPLDLVKYIENDFKASDDKFNYFCI